MLQPPHRQTILSVSEPTAEVGREQASVPRMYIILLFSYLPLFFQNNTKK